MKKLELIVIFICLFSLNIAQINAQMEYNKNEEKVEKFNCETDKECYERLSIFTRFYNKCGITEAANTTLKWLYSMNNILIFLAMIRIGYRIYSFHSRSFIIATLLIYIIGKQIVKSLIKFLSSRFTTRIH